MYLQNLLEMYVLKSGHTTRIKQNYKSFIEKYSQTRSKVAQNLQTSGGYIFHISQYFVTRLHNFTKFRMLFPTMLMNLPNSKVFLIGEWSIANGKLLILTSNIILLSFWLEECSYR